MFSRTHALLISIVVVSLAGIAPPVAAGSTVATPTPSTADTTPLTTADRTANNSTTAAPISAERAVALIRSGRASTSVANVTAALEAHGDRLNASEAAYRWLLVQQATAEESVPAGALSSVATRLPDEQAREVVADVRASLPDRNVEQLRESLAGIGSGWSVEVSGWLDEHSSRTTASRTTAAPTTASEDTGDARDGSSGDYSEAGTGIVSAIREDFSTPNDTSVRATLKPNLFITDLEWSSEGYVLVTVVNARATSEQLVITDSNDMDTSGGYFSMDQTTVTLPPGRFTIKASASVDRGDQTITIDASGMDGLAGFSDEGGGGAPNPWGVGGASVGWTGGLSAAVVMGLLAHRRSGKQTLPDVESLSTLNYP